MRYPRIALILCALALAAVTPELASAQSSYLYGLSLSYGLGGSSDTEPDAGFSNGTYQVGFSLNTEPRTRFGLRAGTLKLDGNGRFGELENADLTYVTAAGEYRYRTSFYDSGLYLGLGGYKLAGRHYLDGTSQDETSLGLALGLTGEFAISRRWSVLIELSGHYADFEEAQIFAMGHLGIGFYF